jgi:hypothetical protein
MYATLTDIINDLEPVVRNAVSGLHIEPAGPRYHVSLSIALYTQGTAPSATREHRISVDTEHLPDGVSVAGWTRWPNLERDLDPFAQVEEQIRDLSATGLLGTLDAARFTPLSDPDLPPRWNVKTHAGSQAERSAWLLTLPRPGLR